MIHRRSSYDQKESSARRYLEAQQFRSHREPVPCFKCGASGNCRHRIG